VEVSDLMLMMLYMACSKILDMSGAVGQHPESM